MSKIYEYAFKRHNIFNSQQKNKNIYFVNVQVSMFSVLP